MPNGAYDLQQQQDGSFQSVPLGPVPDHASFNWSTPSMISHVPSAGEYKALITTWSYTGPGRITQTCNVITLGASATGGKARWRARPCPPVAGTSYFRDRVVVDGVAYLLSRSSYSYSYADIKNSDGIESPDAIFAFNLATDEWKTNILHGPL